jgi:hypothetical protein
MDRNAAAVDVSLSFPFSPSPLSSFSDYRLTGRIEIARSVKGIHGAGDSA